MRSLENLVWVEITRSALANNITFFRNIVGNNVILCPCVKANAYGHDLIKTARFFLENGADWLGVNADYEALALVKNGVKSPIYIMGGVNFANLEIIVKIGARLVVYNKETVVALANAANKVGKMAYVHIKIETGNNRQGISVEDIVDFARFVQAHEFLKIEGLATHFANIEDTTDHSYAFGQFKKFQKTSQTLTDMGIKVPIRHCANSAATILFPHMHLEMVRPGIATYGMWPSNETYVSFIKENAEKEFRGPEFALNQAFNWKTKIVQIKNIEEGEYIGYGCTYKTVRDSRLAILPLGYYDGYDRGIGMRGHVLICGKRAPIRGRICMNIMMVDVTDIPEAGLGAIVTLIGIDGEEKISPEMMAGWADTINYEITTRVNDRIPREFV